MEAPFAEAAIKAEWSQLASAVWSDDEGLVVLWPYGLRRRRHCTADLPLVHQMRLSISASPGISEERGEAKEEVSWQKKRT